MAAVDLAEVGILSLLLLHPLTPLYSRLFQFVLFFCFRLFASVVSFAFYPFVTTQGGLFACCFK